MTLRPVGTNVHLLVRVAEPDNLTDGRATSITTTLHHEVLEDAAGLRLVFANRHNRLGHDEPGPDPIEVRAGLARPGGRSVPVRFDGGESVRLAPGAVVLSDPVRVVVTAGEVLTSRTTATVQAGGRIPLGPEPDVLAGEQVEASGPGAPPRHGYGPWQVLGEGAATAPVVFVAGDSNAVGFGDVRGSARHRGWVRRALEPSRIPHVNLSVSGATALGASTPDGLADRLTLLRWTDPTLAVAALGTNDLQGGGPDLPEMQRRLTALWRLLSGAGRPVVACTLPPVTLSSDGWRTTAGQRPDAGLAVRERVNDWVRTLPEPLTGFIDLAAAVGADGRWLPGCTDDGVHLSAAGHAAAAAGAARALWDLALP